MGPGVGQNRGVLRQRPEHASQAMIKLHSRTAVHLHFAQADRSCVPRLEIRKNHEQCNRCKRRRSHPLFPPRLSNHWDRERVEDERRPEEHHGRPVSTYREGYAAKRCNEHENSCRYLISDVQLCRFKEVSASSKEMILSRIWW